MRSTNDSNTLLDDIAAVIGFSATLRLAAWYGSYNRCYVPAELTPEHHLISLLGQSAAKKLVEEWGGKHLSVPRLVYYDEWKSKREIGMLLAHGLSTQHVAALREISERRVQQIYRELEVAGLVPVIGPGKEGAKNRGKTPLEKTGAKKGASSEEPEPDAGGSVYFT